MTKPRVSRHKKKTDSYTAGASPVNLYNVVMLLAAVGSLATIPTYFQLFSPALALEGSLATSSTAAALTGQGFFPPAPQAPCSLPKWQQDLVAPTCDNLTIKKALERCVHAATEEIRSKVVRIINGVMSANQSASYYISFVLAYLEGFKIVIGASKPEETTTLVYTAEESTLSLNHASDLDDPRLPQVLRSGFRQAYWHAINKYAFKSFSNTSNIHSSIDGMTEKKYRAYIDKGMEELASLKKMLGNEQSGNLTAKDRSTLQQLRTLYSGINDDFYPSVIQDPTDPVLLAGESYKTVLGAPFPNISAEITVLRKSQTSFGHPFLVLVFHDPVIPILNMADELLMCLSDSSKAQYCKEFDTCIASFFPKALAERFFPEIEAYNKKLQDMSLHSPWPNAMHYQSPSLLSTAERVLASFFAEILTDEEHLAYLANNEAYFLSFFEKNDSDFIIKQLQAPLLFYREKISRGAFISKGFAQLQDVKSILRLHIKHQKSPEEAHRLLARAYRLERGQAQEICKHYKAAFKALEQNKGLVTFDEADYIDYYDALVEINDTGKANIVAGKGVAIFKDCLELQHRWAMSKSFQQNREPLRLKPF